MDAYVFYPMDDESDRMKIVVAVHSQEEIHLIRVTLTSKVV